MEYLRLFGSNLLPAFALQGAGYLLASRVRVDARAVAHVAFMIFAPCLIYRVIVESAIPAVDLLRMMGFATATLLCVGLVAATAARIMGLSRTMASAIILCSLLPNVGNLGLSVNMFAFGEAGLAQASVFFLTGSILAYTVGVFVASLGRASLKEAALGLLRVPAIWGAIAAFVMVNRGWQLPMPVNSAVELLAAACIPTFLVILGIQMRGVRMGAVGRPLLAATGLRLIVSAAMAVLFARAFALEGPALQAGVLQASMPTAVITIILATEYDVEPAFVTSVVFLTTLLSPLTLTPLLAWLR